MLFGLLVVIVFGLITYLLARSHAGHQDLYPRLPWGMENEDWEAARFHADLRAARDRQEWTPRTAHPYT